MSDVNENEVSWGVEDPLEAFGRAIDKVLEMEEEAERGRLAKKDVLTAKEAARFLRVSRDAIYLAANRNEVPHGRIGRRLVFSRRALLDWLEAKVTAPAENELEARGTLGVCKLATR